MKDINFIAILPSDKEWLTGGIFYDYELMKVLEVTNIFKITSSKIVDYIGILKYLTMNITKDKKNIVIIDAASIIYLIPFLLLKQFFGFEILTLHMHLQGKKDSLKQKIFKWSILNLSNKIITISEYSNNELLPRKADLIIYPPLKIIEKINVKNKLNKITLLFVGSIIRRKNIILLIKLMKLLDKRYKLTICGNIVDNEYYEELISFTKKNSLRDRIEFTGKVTNEELTNKYNIADIFIFPSVLEGFGMVNIEAMYLGIPVFASDVGPHREIIKDSEDGFLFDVDDLELLKKRIDDFVANTNLHKEISKHAKIKAESFIWKNAKIKKNILKMFYDKK